MPAEGQPQTHLHFRPQEEVLTVERLLWFIKERELIRRRKESGRPQSTWTTDSILQEFRFCNVQREDDRVTRWIKHVWRDPFKYESDLWFAMVVARFINWPDTLGDIGYPVPWDNGHFLEVMDRRKREKKKLYTGAYMVRADMEHKDKAEYQANVVFGPMWDARERLRPKEGDTLNSYHMLLGQFHGLGSFMAAQIVADLKYVPPLSRATDWWTFAASGPGSRRGLNRVLGRDMSSIWTEEDWRSALGRLSDQVRKRLRDIVSEGLHNQDLQNCLCEFDKYERVRRGEGKPRARYVSHG